MHATALKKFGCIRVVNVVDFKQGVYMFTELDILNSDFVDVVNNVIYVDFKALSKPTVSSGGELIVVDFVNKRRAA